MHERVRRYTKERQVITKFLKKSAVSLLSLWQNIRETCRRHYAKNFARFRCSRDGTLITLAVGVIMFNDGVIAE